MKKAYCFISDHYTGQSQEVGLLEKVSGTRSTGLPGCIESVRPNYYLLHLEVGNRVFPMVKRSVEVYYFNPDGTVDFNRQPDLAIEDPYDYGKNTPVHPYREGIS